MSDYIKREALLKDIEEERPVNWTDSESERQAESDFYKYRDIVMMQPTADVVEVVRCKDCEFYKLRNVSSRYKPTKPCCLRKAAVTVNENDYCSYGKRKEGAEE